MAVTKSPKKVKLSWKEEKYIRYTSEYQCPSCRTIFQGFVSDKNTIRFRCKCGQELIIEEAQQVIQPDNAQ
jgi:predicted SprT family Zn-dependent metalloprotease